MILRLVCAVIALVFSAGGAAANDRDGHGEALDIYRTIIGFRTAEGHGKVPEMAAYLAAQLKSAGFADEDIEIMPMGETAALVVRYRGKPGSGKRPVLFLGHMDVVDALAADWERSPFSLSEDDTYFYGRGTLDNKLGITMLTTAFMDLKRSGFVPGRDLILAFSGDEESGMKTTRALVNKLAPERPEFALNSDAGGGMLRPDGVPLAYMLQVAEKTFVTFDMKITNPGGHSSRPRTDNAIYELAGALKRIEAYQFPVQYNDVTRSFFRALGEVTPGEGGALMKRFAANPDDRIAQAAFIGTPFVGATRTTCVATQLAGGHAQNALPQSASAAINCRVFPGTPVAEVQAKLAAVAGNDRVVWTQRKEATQSPVSKVRSDVMAALRAAIDARAPGLPIIPYMEAGGTDGMHFRNAGIPTFAMSSGFIKPNEMFAHGLNERIPKKSFAEGLEHWLRIIRGVAGQ